MAVEAVSDIALVFMIIGGFILISNHLSLPTIPSYIMAGVLAGFFIQQENIIEMARWGLTFIIFAFGVSINFQDIKKVIWESEIILGFQILTLGISSFVIGIILGLGHTNSFYFTVAVILSSTIIGFKLMGKNGKSRLVHGRLSESIQFTDDLFAILIIVILGVIALDEFTAFLIVKNLVYVIIMFMGSFLIYRYGFKYIIKAAGGSGELILMGSISLLVIFLGLCELLGISLLVGAFAAGLAVKIEPYRCTAVVTGVESIKYFFSAIFFAMLGGLLNMPSPYTLILALALILLVALFKPLVTTLILTKKDYDTRTAALTGIRFSQMSEFTLIIAIEGFLIGLLVLELFDAIIIASVVTMIYSSVILSKDEGMYDIFKRIFKHTSMKKTDEKSSVRSDIRDHVIIIGYGRQGKILSKKCKTNNIESLIIENDPVKIGALERDARHHVFGDAMNDYTWEKAKAKKAKIVISTVDDTKLSEKLISMGLGCPVIPKSFFQDETKEFFQRGVKYVNNPKLLADSYVREEVIKYFEGKSIPK